MEMEAMSMLVKGDNLSIYSIEIYYIWSPHRRSLSSFQIYYFGEPIGL